MCLNLLALFESQKHIFSNCLFGNLTSIKNYDRNTRKIVLKNKREDNLRMKMHVDLLKIIVSKKIYSDYHLGNMAIEYMQLL